MYTFIFIDRNNDPINFFFTNPIRLHFFLINPIRNRRLVIATGTGPSADG
jgi:hypothetical protein